MVQRLRHYYTDDRRFEQSLDIWLPTDDSSARPLLVLVVGSAWMGHQPMIYAVCDWWNSSGPRRLAEAGYPTIAIRHRGAFFRRPTWLPWAAAGLVLAAYLHGCLKMMWQVLAGSLLLIECWARLEKGCATMDDMLEDVADALQWVDAYHRYCFGSRHKVIGGYSSGAHVALSLLQQPERLQQRKLHVETIAHGCLLLSGVLGVRPVDKSTSSWCADFVTTAVFGSTAVPNPIDQVISLPTIPYLLVECREELFGLRWLDAFFCSSSMARRLVDERVPVCHAAIRSNHWAILNEPAMVHAVEEGLAWAEGLWDKAHSSPHAPTPDLHHEAVTSATPRQDELRRE